ncbi:MAG: 50S ribosomal protein L9 [Candidatus Portnoybacteria bacterium CG10_big_fil_rev_8_21_14_0_10_36_7]|uniref:Large ribosomal subunit protein bL9 n=1 Tax=Candidatus Portnoybacteria bacterium CG10_big_fil_rev_8_21_14_0_10_36_7 TaxID=1974812 RepID=A0A2M8KE69_9BACT|nr:MAG: 50S ribosomal protein L9 [Candidatus Portnoybacteria bacterium CG10_big_fil_rev_8_21_14_0_10_36_7]
MKVILLKDVINIGKKNDIKDVADGYGRNFLIKKRLAMVATEDTIKSVLKMKEKQAKQAELELEKYQTLAQNIDGQELGISAKASTEGKLYGSINNAKIAQELKKIGFSIKKHDFKIDEHIKETGEHDVTMKFPHNLEAKIKIVIIPLDK